MQRFVSKDVLKALPLLALLPQTALAQLLTQSSVVALRKGATLFHEGEPCGNLYRIISGRCESYEMMADGTIKHLAILGPGDYAGEPDFSGQTRHRNSVRVITDSVLQQIPCIDLRALLQANDRQ